MRTEPQGGVGKSCDPVHSSSCGLGMVLGLRMDLSLQLGSEEVQPWGKEELGLSLRPLTCEVIKAMLQVRMQGPLGGILGRGLDKQIL